MEAINQITALSLDSMQHGFAHESSVIADRQGLSEQFMQTLGEVKAEVSEKSHQIELNLDQLDDLSPQRLLQVQIELMQVTLQQELISKGVSKTTQNVDTLIKAQ